MRTLVLEGPRIGDLVVTPGDVLEPSAPVRQVLIGGVQQPMASMQAELYRRYRRRLQWRQVR